VLICEAKMALTMRRVLSALVIVLLAASSGACKSPPPHTDSTKGTTKQDRDTGMHDSQM
jgi:hypothetical protein